MSAKADRRKRQLSNGLKCRGNLVDDAAAKPVPVQSMKTTTSKSKNGTVNAQAELAEINREIQSLHQKRIGLAEPLKIRFGELRNELMETQNQIRELDPSWKPASLVPKADDVIRGLIAEKGPMTEAEIITALGDRYTRWKIKTILKRKFSADAAGKFSPKA